MSPEEVEVMQKVIRTLYIAGKAGRDYGLGLKLSKWAFVLEGILERGRQP